MGELVPWSISDGGRRCGQRVSWDLRSEGFPLGEHLPDRFGELAGDLDPGDFGAALAAEADLGALVVIDVDGVSGGVDGSFDEGPAQVLGAVLG